MVQIQTQAFHLQYPVEAKNQQKHIHTETHLASVFEKVFDKVFVCFYFLFFKKCRINGRLRLKLPCICCTSTSATCCCLADPTPSQATPPKSTWSAKTAAFTWDTVNALPSHGDTLTSWMVPKKKAQATSVSGGSLPICSCNFPFSSEDHIFQEAANVCCRCFQSPPPFHWATLTVKTKPLASAPARPKSACS